MVNSSLFGSDKNENSNASPIQADNRHNKSQSSSPITATSATQSILQAQTHAVEPTPSKTDFDDDRSTGIFSEKLQNDDDKKRFFCSVPLEKVQTIITKYATCKDDDNKARIPRKVLCLYCDRTFVNTNLRHKHIERCHSSKHLRRVSLRKHQNVFTSTPCIYCDKYTSTEHTLDQLFEHLVQNHANKYFACLPCGERYLNLGHLNDHNGSLHNNIKSKTQVRSSGEHVTVSHLKKVDDQKQHSLKIVKKRKKQRKKIDNKLLILNTRRYPRNCKETKKSLTTKTLENKKMSIKKSRMVLKRSKRLEAKLNDSQKSIDVVDKRSNKQDQTFTTKLNVKSAKTSSHLMNSYPDNYFQIKKITDHSIDNLKISSLTFDDVFDKAFFNRIKCNIQENLLHHIDGKLFKNEESESRISNFEKNSNVTSETQNINSENFGCELSLNAIAPTTLFLSTQFGEDPESQIEYGSKPSKKRTQIKQDQVHYKYFTRRKYQASILEHKENRDLSKLDMWTQYVIKNRQQKVLCDGKSKKEMSEYFAGEEYKNLVKREELDRILDRRGPFEDLREEASKNAAREKLNNQEENVFAQVGELLNDLLDRVFELAQDTINSSVSSSLVRNTTLPDCSEIPSYLNLRPITDSSSENEIDRSDKIALICSSQETENFEHPNNAVREKNEKVELTGEWARSRIFVCAACGLKLLNIKQFLEHKSASHQYIWVQHYEFVGNQSKLYRHLSIPVLGKVGVLENTQSCKMWKRSDSRLCTKCGKQCNSLGELHRHILECGGDWTWMLVRRKCKYKPFGAKSRRKRRGLVKRIYRQKTEPGEKATYKKRFDVPRQKPSDADSIKRMLANLPAKRSTRKVVSLNDQFNKRQRKQKVQNKFKCGKLISTTTKEEPTNDNNRGNRRSMRSLNKVLTSRILETNSSIIVRSKYKRKLNQNSRQTFDKSNNKKRTLEEKISVKNVNKVENVVNAIERRCSPRIEKHLQYATVFDKMNIKRFFPVKKKKNTRKETAKKNSDEITTSSEIGENGNIEETTTDKSAKEKVANKKQKLRNDFKRAVQKIKVLNANNKSNAVEESSTIELTSDITLKNDEPMILDNIEVQTTPENKLEEAEKNDTIEFLPLTPPAPPSPLPLPSYNIITHPPNIKKMKKKRKPARGLDDCIAMLTSKLENSVKNSLNENILDAFAAAQEQHNEIEKSEFILKVPLTNEHFKLYPSRNNCSNHSDSEIIPEAQVTSLSVQENVDEVLQNKSCAISKNIKDMQEEKKILENDVTVVGDVIGEVNPIDHLSINCNLNDETTVSVTEECVSNLINTISNNTSQELINDTDSEDEVPLSKLVNFEDNNKVEVFEFTASIDIDERKNNDFAQEVVSLENSFPMDCVVENEPDNDLKGEIQNDTTTECKDVSIDEITSLTTDKVDNAAKNMDEDIDKLKMLETTTGNLITKRKTKKKFAISGGATKENKKSQRHTNFDRKKKNNKNSQKTTKAKTCILDDALLELTGNAQIKDNTVYDKTIDSNLEESSPTNVENETSLPQQTTSEDNTSDLAQRELRRSRRNSKKITCYNEVDLVDPMFDELDSGKNISKIIKEATKNMFKVKRKNRFNDKKLTRIDNKEIKLNGDELFDLLKETPSDNLEFSKPTNSFFNNFDEIDDDFNDDNFDVLEDILQKSMAVLEENLADHRKVSADNISLSINDVAENESEENLIIEPTDEQNGNINSRKRVSKNFTYKKRKKIKRKTFENTLKTLLSSSDAENNENSITSSNSQIEDNKINYCEICDKSFTRIENLTKHKRTLTHISKLSELEANEAAKKCDIEKQGAATEHLLQILDDPPPSPDDCKETACSFSVNVNDSKLADIINDVLNKPVLVNDENQHNFTDIFHKNTSEIPSPSPPPQPSPPSLNKRCKSLAERKCFDSDAGSGNDSLQAKDVNYYESEIPQEAAGIILEKQITLLENIIENRSGITYIDEISITSNQSQIIENEQSLGSLKPVEDNFAKENLQESFLKPSSQYEEISEDSNLKNYEEQKSRKALNRDEELFLECCSLLKSSSELSCYSKKSNNLSKYLNNIEIKPCEERDWTDNNCLPQKDEEDFEKYFSDNSRIATPLGDNFSQDNSSSATISSHWNVNNSKEDLKEETLTFKQVFDNKKSHIADEEQQQLCEESYSTMESMQVKNRNESKLDSDNLEESSDDTSSAAADGKKVLTKGAMKVFEGLKVSIPTEELNMAKILGDSSSMKSIEFKNSSQVNNNNTHKRLHKKRNTKLIKMKKHHNNLKIVSSKSHDVYDFEETQDNSDIFTRPDFKSFRNNNGKSVKKTDKSLASDDESQDEGVSYDAFSSSASSVCELITRKSRTHQNITKKKCMIMGRIFKNAVKSKNVDEDIRTIPVVDNSKLVQDFVMSCPQPVENNKMTEEEMNLAFDRLINNTKATHSIPNDKVEQKSHTSKRKTKIKHKKRAQRGSDESDDEFRLQQPHKKRSMKGGKDKSQQDNCINLEQELKECIGVASRKSQRKCTSGKQNVLIEYWSSDESSFETVIESQITKRTMVESEQQKKKIPHDDAENKLSAKKQDKEIVDERIKSNQEISSKKPKLSPTDCASSRRKRSTANPLYHWSSSSEDESRDLIEVRPIRDEIEDDDDRPMQHGWIVGDSPKKLVTMLAQAKGKKCETDTVKECGKKRTNTFS